MLQQAVEIALLPAEIRGRNRRCLLVRLAQLALADGLLDNPLVAGHQAGIDLPEQLLSEFRFQLPAERGFRQGLLPRVELRNRFREGCLQPFDFPFIEGVVRVDRIPHIRQAVQGIGSLFLFLQRKIDIPDLRGALRFAHLPGSFLHCGLQSLKIRAFIRHFTEPDHRFFPSFPFLYVIFTGLPHQHTTENPPVQPDSCRSILKKAALNIAPEFPKV